MRSILVLDILVVLLNMWIPIYSKAGNIGATLCLLGAITLCLLGAIGIAYSLGRRHE